jgi:hypothetical protein
VTSLPCSGLTHLFFPELPYGTARYNHAVNQARITCVRCPHRLSCLAGAQARGEQYGVWGAVDMGGKARDRRGGSLRRTG